MKNLFFIFSICLFCIIPVKAQKVTGIVTDSNGVRLAGAEIKLYSIARSVNTTSNYDGKFLVEWPTSVEKNFLPEGYNVSNNYPNPFNPKTRIAFELPKASNIKVEIFNLTGQRVRDAIETLLSAGNNHLDIDLDGLPNGFYFARIVINGNYTVTKKLMLLYGSQHLNTAINSANVKVAKTKKDVFIDSIVISSDFLETTRINILTDLTGNTLDLGKIKVKKLPDPPYTSCPGIPTITYEGKTYNTVFLDSLCWLKENLDIGVMINSAENPSNNNIIEKSCYNNDPENCFTYGGLYTWDEAMQYVTTENAKGICPQGWHIPSVNEFNILNKNELQYGNKLKSTGQGLDIPKHYLYGKGTNESGFSVLMASDWDCSNVIFGNLGATAYFWSSNEENTDRAFYIDIYAIYSTVFIRNNYKAHRFSIRCVKDN